MTCTHATQHSQENDMHENGMHESDISDSDLCESNMHNSFAGQILHKNDAGQS